MSSPLATTISMRAAPPDEATASPAVLRMLLDCSTDLLYAKDTSSRFTYANRALARRFGYDDGSDLVGKSDADLYPAARAAEYAAVERRLLERGEPLLDFLERQAAGDGAERWTLTSKMPVRDGAGRIVGLVGTCRDATEQMWVEQELRFQGELLDQATASVVATDAAGSITHWNRHAERVYGWTRGEAIGRTIAELDMIPLAEGVMEAIGGRVLAGESWDGEYECRDRSGGIVVVQSCIAPVLSPAGEVVGTVSVSLDIAERKAMEVRLARLAYADPLTGLHNRVRFLDRLEAAMQDGGEPAVVFLDLDHFKVVNDSLGHGAGDRLLIQAAGRLGACIRPVDTLARLGGDEFAVLLTGPIDAVAAGTVAERMVAAIRAPFDLDGHSAFVGASAGITFARTGSGGPEDLLREADVALYEAKGKGRGGWALFDAEIGARALRRLDLETELRRALERGELELHYQPVVELATDAIHGFEALVRWRHPERGLLGPGEFIDLAEETGLIVPLGEWVLAEACRQGAAWLAMRPGQRLIVGVNVSPRQLRSASLGPALQRILAETGMPASLLKLEVTEHALVEDDAVAASFLGSLKGLGVRLALDDFGTGHSSLSRLYRLPLDVLKIDRSFLTTLGQDPHAGAVIRAVVALGHEFGMAVVAEGIETEAQRQAAQDLGCDRGQGYLFARPLQAAAATALLLAGSGPVGRAAGTQEMAAA